jgi:hypothetical protein
MAIAISTLSLSTGSREDFPGEDLSLIGMFLAFHFSGSSAVFFRLLDQMLILSEDAPSLQAS